MPLTLGPLCFIWATDAGPALRSLLMDHEAKLPREEIAAEIAREERRLGELRSEIRERGAKLDALRQKLRKLGDGEVGACRRTSPGHGEVGPASNAEKVSLFRSLFRGREDVFPKRWENARTGKSGYSLACAVEWEPGVCVKRDAPGRKGPKATCGACPNQAFLPVTDEEISRHLRGDHVMGAYPLLADETCWFLAVDFDKKAWQDDVSAFVETCRRHGVPVAVERSRSGNGAHAWFFFSGTVPAAAARKMGCFLITETMSRRHQLSMGSYDRLFPNQDVMPKGGFGNLIALPLQREVRDAGNSVFVDSTFAPYGDQWAFLANQDRLEPCLVLGMADEAARRGQIVGVRMSETDDDYGRTPWMRSPSGRAKRIPITEPLPSEIRCVLSQRLFIEKARLPSPLLNQFKRLAAFQNPEFYKRQNMRLSTALTPRVISCAEDLPEHVSLPRGCAQEVELLLRKLDVTLSLDDRRVEGTPVDLEFRGDLTPLQDQAARELLAHDTGVFVAPPGMGKTVVGIYLAAARGRNTLILVHRKPLLEQWIAQLMLFLGLKRKDIGQIGGGRRRPNGRIDVGMLQSLARKGEVDSRVAGYGHVIVDECHHLPAVSFERVLSEVKARYVTGLTATPRRRDGHHPIIHMQVGPVRLEIPSGNQAEQRPFVHRLIVRETPFAPGALRDEAGIQELYAALAADSRRNDLIFDDVIRALEEGRSPILLTERRDHLELLAGRFRSFTRNLIVLHGGMKTKERREALRALAETPEGEERLLLATGRYIGEGFDDARLDTLFLALPISWKGTLVQYTGRLHRLRPGKQEVRIYDYVDRQVPMLLRMFEKRLRGYRAIGYTMDDSSEPILETEDEITVEYDKEALRTFD